jgi:hypothetical protein
VPGFLLFTVLLTFTFWIVGLIAIAGWLPLVGSVGLSVATIALGFLIGARVADTVVMHVSPHIVGYRPNPGLSSTLLYLIEAAYLTFVFYERLSAYPNKAVVGLAIGIIFFLAVPPSIWLLRFVLPSKRRTPWMPWHPMPQWASTKW